MKATLNAFQCRKEALVDTDSAGHREIGFVFSGFEPMTDRLIGENSTTALLGTPF